jgi:hypothetical protein
MTEFHRYAIYWAPEAGAFPETGATAPPSQSPIASGFQTQTKTCYANAKSRLKVTDYRKSFRISRIEVRKRRPLKLPLEQSPVFGNAAMNSFAPEAKT